MSRSRDPLERSASTRRGLLAAIGCLALAGCTELWSRSSPSINGDRLAAIVDDTDVPTVDHEYPLPVSDDHVEASVQQVGELIESIPQPIDTETIPNEAVRERIERRRERASEDLEAAPDEPTSRDLLERLRNAHGSGAEAAGIWEAVDDEQTRDDVSESVADLRTARLEFDQEWEYHVGDDPLEAVFTYADTSRLTDEAFEEITAVTDIDEPVESLAVGEMAAHREKGRVALEDAVHVYSRYVDSLEETDTTVIAGAAETLEAELSGEWWMLQPEYDAHELVDRDIDPDSTSASVLAHVQWDLRGERRGAPSIDFEPARYVQYAHGALLALDGFERVRARIDGGDSIEIDDADDVDAYRIEAIDGIKSLLEEDSRPLERQTAFDLTARFDQPDRSLRSAAGESIDSESVTYPVAQYCWFAGMAEATPEVVDTVYEALEA